MAKEIPFLERLSCTVPEAISGTGIPRTKIYKLRKAGVIEMFRIDGRSFVSVASLKRLIDKGQEAAAS